YTTLFRSIEEVIGRPGLGVRRLSGRVGEMPRVRGRDERDLILGHEAHQRFGVGRTPAQDGDRLEAADPTLVGGDGARRLVGVVDRLAPNLAAVDAAVAVDVLDGVLDTLAVGLSD